MEKKRRCLICDNPAAHKDVRAGKLLALTEDFEVMHCQKCQFRWLSPQLSEEEYDEVYSSLYFGGDAENGTAEIPAWLKPYPAPNENYSEMVEEVRRAAFEKRLTRLKRLRPQLQSILDVGAGTGTFVDTARKSGFDCSGIETGSSACEIARSQHGIELQNVKLSEVESSKTFDCIHLSHVFEHLVDPEASLQILWELLRDDGLLVIEVPNQFENTIEKIKKLLLTEGGITRSLHSIHHPYFYTPLTLSTLLLRNGFEVLSTQSYFSERWSTGGTLRKILRGIDWVADVLGSSGREFEIIAAKAELDPSAEAVELERT